MTLSTNPYAEAAMTLASAPRAARGPASADATPVPCDCRHRRCRAVVAVTLRQLALTRARGVRIVIHEHRHPTDEIVGIADHFLLVHGSSGAPMTGDEERDLAAITSPHQRLTRDERSPR